MDPLYHKYTTVSAGPFINVNTIKEKLCTCMMLQSSGGIPLYLQIGRLALSLSVGKCYCSDSGTNSRRTVTSNAEK